MNIIEYATLTIYASKSYNMKMSKNEKNRGKRRKLKKNMEKIKTI